MVRKQTLGLLCKPRLAARAHCFLAFPQVWIKGGPARSSAPPALLQAAGALAFRRAWPWGRPPTRFPCPVFPVPAPDLSSLPFLEMLPLLRIAQEYCRVLGSFRKPQAGSLALSTTCNTSIPNSLGLPWTTHTLAFAE